MRDCIVSMPSNVAVVLTPLAVLPAPAVPGAPLPTSWGRLAARVLRCSCARSSSCGPDPPPTPPTPPTPPYPYIAAAGWPRPAARYAGKPGYSEIGLGQRKPRRATGNERSIISLCPVRYTCKKSPRGVASSLSRCNFFRLQTSLLSLFIVQMG